MDELGSDPTPPSRRARVLVVLVVLLLVAGVVADRRQRDRELDALLEAVVAGEAVVVASQRSQAGLAQYQSALLAGSDIPSGAKDAAYANLARDAQRWLPRLDRQRAQVQAVALLPWHDEVRRARRAYGERVQAWTEVLRRTADDPRGPDVPDDVAPARALAAEALLGAGAPPDRVTALLGEGRARTGG